MAYISRNRMLIGNPAPSPHAGRGPPPTRPPGPIEPSGAGGSRGERKLDKKRRTSIIRVWSTGEGNEDSWVDLECLESVTMSGAQFPHLFGSGNYPSDTTMTLDHTPGRGGNREESIAKIQMDPKEEKYFVEVPVIQSTILNTPGCETLTRTFFNGRENSTCEPSPNKHAASTPNGPGGPPVGQPPDQNNPLAPPPSGGGGDPDRKRIQVGLRIVSNNIDDDLLVESNDPKRKAPPSNPKTYIEKVRQTDDEGSVYLSVYMPFGVYMSRGKTSAHQEMQFASLWFADTGLAIPGAEKSDKGDTHVVIDPYRAIVNFGPDSLAVEFGDGEGDAPGFEPPPTTVPA